MSWMQAFEETYKREFGFVLEQRSIIVDDLRVRATGKVTLLPDCATTGKNVSLSRQASAGCCTDKAQRVTHVVKHVCTLLAKSICAQ